MFDGGVNGPVFVTCHVLVKEIGWAVPWATHFAVANLEEGAAETENWGMTSRNGKWKSCFLSQQGTRLDLPDAPVIHYSGFDVCIRYLTWDPLDSIAFRINKESIFCC